MGNILIIIELSRKAQYSIFVLQIFPRQGRLILKSLTTHRLCIVNRTYLSMRRFAMQGKQKGLLKGPQRQSTNRRIYIYVMHEKE